MGELGAFLREPRVDNPERDPRERVHDFREFLAVLPEAELSRQGARCASWRRRRPRSRATRWRRPRPRARGS